MSWDPALVATAIDAFPAEAGAALLAIQQGAPVQVTAETFEAAAAARNVPRTAMWVDKLIKMDKLDAFAEALRARGVPLRSATEEPELDEEAMGGPDRVLDPAKFSRFVLQASAFRCRLLVNGQDAGSGCLIGPSLVLTTWHVIAVKPPGQKQEPPPSIEIRLADEHRVKARLPAPWESESGANEYLQVAPKADNDVADRKDVVVLKLDSPAAAHLGFAPLPAVAPPTFTPSLVYLFDFPEGMDRGFGNGRTRRMPNVTLRWQHTIKNTAPGSSGGACFNERMEIIGLHQGKWGTYGRMVPLSQFIDNVRPLVTDDTAPQFLWSLDGTVDGALVVGRDVFFQGIAEAGKPDTRVRGVWIKRADIKAGATGLAFSYDLVVQLLALKGVSHKAVRVPFDDLVADLGDQIRRRSEAVGVTLPAPEVAAGVAPGEAAPAGATKDQAEALAKALNAAAGADDLTLWFFFDNPSVSIPEPARLFLEAFVAAALVQPRLRLVLAGLETLQLAGLEFETPGAAVGANAPGLVVEFLKRFTLAEVLDFLRRASEALTGGVNLETNKTLAALALQGVPPFNDTYEQADLPTVVARLADQVRLFKQQAGGAG